MIERIDLKKVFKAARQKGFESSEIFAENSFWTTISIENRIAHAWVEQTTGISLRCVRGGLTAQFSTTEISTEALLHLLDDSSVSECDSFPLSSQSSSSELKTKKESLSHFQRKAVSPEVLSFFLEYTDRVKEFEVARDDGSEAQGQEEEAWATCRWEHLSKGASQWEEKSFARASIKDFWEHWNRSNPLLSEIQRSVRSQSPWPAPQGEIPILWSSQALSKLFLPFVRAFEGDYVLTNLSLLNQIPQNLSLAFGLQEAQQTLVDNEGSRVREVILLEAGQPRAVACDRWIADQLNRPSTGHCRRSSYESAPTVALWSPKILPNDLDPDLQKHLERGIHVRDLKILQSHPASPWVELELSDAVLFHHGEAGEAIEPLRFRLNLLEFLPTLKTFSADTESWGFPVIKNHQRFMMEIETGAALSVSFALPGSVPSSHYW